MPPDVSQEAASEAFGWGSVIASRWFIHQVFLLPIPLFVSSPRVLVRQTLTQFAVPIVLSEPRGILQPVSRFLLQHVRPDLFAHELLCAIATSSFLSSCVVFIFRLRR